MVKLNVKHLSTALIVFYVLSIIPMIILGFYNFPSADDFSMALETHRHFRETGSVLSSLGYGLYMGYWYYMNWTGYFFSAALTALCPGVFSEGLYPLTTIIMLGSLTLGVFFFFDAVVVKKLGISKYYARIISVLALLPMIQSMPREGARNEAFYWYSGSINYCFMFGLGLFWLGLMIRLSEKKSTALIAATSVLGFLLGGANYMTALSLAVMSAAFVIFDIYGRKKTLIFIPALCNIIGLIISMTAPGNSVRGEALNYMNPVVAVFRSIYHVFDMCINEWLTWEVPVMLALVAIICFKAGRSLSIRLRHPVLFSTFCFLMVAVNIVPPLYAMGNFEAGRMVAIIWMQFVLMLVLLVMYDSMWLSQLLNDKNVTESGELLGSAAGSGFLSMLGLLAAGLLLSLYVDPGYITSASAISDLAAGNAGIYAKENRDRLQILKDDSVSDAELKEYSVKPSLLYFSDVTEDTEDWVNKAVADYYEKSSVRLVK
ncbi:DUF6056 family protein [Butyrivibrio sp. MC2021]|uniref:DUF6056 family protein n=1 Tax=Butyrivibrio sp. MC2021 TaxID=1408306 RepID=UPI00047BA47E|nr:DUF6056 family protein [Butyrivibrio sp. MC2021]